MKVKKDSNQKENTKRITKLRNLKHGFSLVELIVVIAIMAVLAVVLVPALIGNVEQSRASKDLKTMDEVVNAVQLALSDEDVYDEILEHSIYDNISCYVDKINESECGEKITTKAAIDGYMEQYTFGNSARKLDETPYYGAGNMRGVTITFSPEKSSSESSYTLAEGIINKFVGRKTGYLSENENLYNRICNTMGNVINNNSQTYRNSDFTIFIRIGTTGGSNASEQDTIEVYGQYSGTNLTANDANLYKLTADRTTGDSGKYDSVINEVNNKTESNKLDFGENSLMGSGTITPSSNSNYYTEYLQTQHEFKYYSSISKAVTDVNDGTIGSNADCNKENAVAGIYVDNGEVNVMLLQDTTETNTLTVSADMIIDLGGNVLSFDNLRNGLNATSGNIVIDGSTSGSAIQISCSDDLWAIAIQTTTNMTVNGGNNLNVYAEAENGVARAFNSAGDLTINSCNLSTYSKSYVNYTVFNYTKTVTITNCNITATSDSGLDYGIYQGNGATATVNDSNITATSKSARAVGIGQSDNATLNATGCNINATSNENYAYGILQFTNNTNQTATITNCDIAASANFKFNEQGYISIFGIGICSSSSTSNLTINNCHVMGTWTSILNYGKLKVDGGTYEGFTHGGFCLQSPEQVVYIKNATIRVCDMPEGYIADEDDRDAIAIPSSNVTVYIDNCDIYGITTNIRIYVIASNSKVYISNSKINLSTKISLGGEDTTNELYIGSGCNFTADNANRPNNVYSTNEIYAKNE